MPELPEVQTIVTDLSSQILNRKIKECKVFRPSVIHGDVKSFIRNVCQEKIKKISRRGKFLIFHFFSEHSLVVHLRMTGKFILQHGPPPENSHNRVLFILSDQSFLIFHDVRCFGRLEYCIDHSTHPGLIKLGVEPLGQEFSLALFQDHLHHRRVAIKNFLLDQSVIAGLGNIYASEILFDCKIHPERNACDLKKTETTLLHASIRKILQLAIQCNGTSISDYQRIDSKTGEFQNFLKVYGKTDQPCRVCDRLITRKIQQQRSTFFCSYCQK